MLYETKIANKKVNTDLTISEIATVVMWYESLVVCGSQLYQEDTKLALKLNELTGNALIFELEQEAEE